MNRYIFRNSEDALDKINSLITDKDFRINVVMGKYFLVLTKQCFYIRKIQSLRTMSFFCGETKGFAVHSMSVSGSVLSECMKEFKKYYPNSKCTVICCKKNTIKIIRIKQDDYSITDVFNTIAFEVKPKEYEILFD